MEQRPLEIIVYVLPDQVVDVPAVQRYQCDICNIFVKHPQSLKLHKLVHSKEKPYKCDICDYAGKRADHLKSHKLIHIAKKPYKCDMCDFASPHSTILKQHKLVHIGEKLYKCNACAYACDRLLSWKTHKKVHREKCGVTATEAGLVREHDSSVEQSLSTRSLETLHRCSGCNYYTTSVSVLQDHVSQHKYSGRLKCPICGVSFVSYIGLRHHVLDHTGEAPYRCLFCDSTFKQEVLAVQHWADKHQEKI